MRETSVVEINLSAVDRNLRLVRSIAGPSCGLCPIVKADAYGLGAQRIAGRLAASGADMLAVYSPEQAFVLARLGLAAPILVFMPVHEIRRSDELHRALVAGRLHLTLHDLAHFEVLDRLAERLNVAIPVHLEVDTGMTRGGSPPEQAIDILRRVAAGSRLRLAGVFTHFSNAGGDVAGTVDQLDRFDRTLAAAGAHLPRECVQHVASTSSLLRHARFHRAMVRFGLAWAGYGHEELEGGEMIADAAGLEPAVTWSSRLVQVRRVAAGTPVGYGSTWMTSRESVLGLVPVGYADGFPRAMPNARGPAFVAVVGDEGPRRFVPVVGTVNMDQITIDLTDAIEPRGSVRWTSIGVGTRIELVTPDVAAPNHLPRLAAASGTIPHEMLCRLAPRGRRVYAGEERPAHALAVGG